MIAVRAIEVVIGQLALIDHRVIAGRALGVQTHAAEDENTEMVEVIEETVADVIGLRAMSTIVDMEEIAGTELALAQQR